MSVYGRSSRRNSVKLNALRLSKFFTELEARKNLYDKGECESRISRLQGILEVTIVDTDDRELLLEVPEILKWIHLSKGFAGVFPVLDEIIAKVYFSFHQRIIPGLAKLESTTTLNENEATFYLSSLNGIFSYYFNSMTLLARYFQPYLRIYPGFRLSGVNLRDSARETFKNLLDKYPLVRDLYRSYIMAEIHSLRNDMRNGCLSHEAPIKFSSSLENICKSFVEMGLYSLIEREYLESTQIYSVVSANLLRSCSLRDYIKEVEAIVAVELFILKKYFDERSSLILNKVIVGKLVIDNKERIFGEAYDVFFGDFDNPDKEILKFSYECFILCSSSTDLLQECFCRAIKDKAAKLIELYSDGPELIPQLLYTKEMILNVIKLCFGSDQSFKDSFEKAFSCSIHFHPNFIAKKTAFYMHHLLVSRRMNKEIVYKMVCLIQSFMALVHDKNAFQTVYHSLAATRLLYNRCSGIEMEKNVSEMLKNDLEKELIYQLGGMFKDLSLGRMISRHVLDDLSPSYNEKPIVVSGMVYSKCYWPYRLSVNMKLSEELEMKLAQLEEAYKLENPDKKLKLHRTGSTGVVSFKTIHGSIDLTVNFAQLAALMLFNNTCELAIGDIRSRIYIDRDSYFLEAMKNLIKYGILEYAYQKDPTEPLSMKDVVRVNYDCNLEDKADVSLCISFKGGDEEPVLNQARKEIVSEVFSYQDKSLYLDATIVRVMKKAKSLIHIHLYEAVKSNVEFQFTVDLLQERIDAMVSKEYIRLNADADIPTYVYIE